MILATLCYIKHDGHTLMVYRNKKANDIHQGKWNGLGGKFEAGETPEECVKLGWAHGALLTTFPGDTTMATVADVRNLAKGGSARIQR